MALDRARAGEAGNLWVVSKKQESGRGRRGRAWNSAEGNLAATLLIVERMDLKAAATLGFVAGLSLAHALDCLPKVGKKTALEHRPSFALKWPNDVLAGGSKLAGILLETHLFPDNRLAVAVGIGVNVVAHPCDAPYPAASLASLGVGCSAEDLFGALSDAWVENVRIWDSGAGMSAIRKLWLARAAGLGKEVAVNIGDTVERGVFETIDDDGRFVIRKARGDVVAIAAGDVHFGAVASASAR